MLPSLILNSWAQVILPLQPPQGAEIIVVSHRAQLASVFLNSGLGGDWKETWKNESCFMCYDGTISEFILVSEKLVEKRDC